MALSYHKSAAERTRALRTQVHIYWGARLIRTASVSDPLSGRSRLPFGSCP